MEAEGRSRNDPLRVASRLRDLRPQDLIEPAFEIRRPAGPGAPLVFNVPHSGRVYPPGFAAASRLDPRDLRSSEDAYVDRLLADAPDLGAPLLRARFPRAYLDVNREPFELDPRLFRDVPAYAETRSLRVAAGLGTVARVVGDGKAIYKTPPDLSEALARIAAYYVPYHRALRDLIEETRARFGVCILIDGHSMPSSSRHTSGSGARSASASTGRAAADRVDFVLGDRHGRACAPAVTQTVQAALTRAGYRVGRNAPYAGGYITEHYGRPEAGVHVLQIEINRALYMDEARIIPTIGFDRVKDALAQAARALIALDAEAYLGLPSAAE